MNASAPFRLRAATQSTTGRVLRCTLAALAWLGGGFPITSSSATLDVAPATAPHTFSGMVLLQITGLQPGETVLLRRWLDANANNTWDPTDLLTLEIRLTDNTVPLIAGVTNWNQPFDQDPTPGQMRVPVNYGRPGLDHAVAAHFWELVSPTARFHPIRQPQLFTNPPLGQGVTGSVRATGTNLPFALVVAIDVVKDGSITAASLTDATGQYQIPLPPGLYALVPAQLGWVTDLENPSLVELQPNQTVRADLDLLPPSRQLSGRVVDATNPSRGLPAVFLQVKSDTGLFAPAWTDTNGNFSVSVRAGSWSVEPAFEDLNFHAALLPEREAQRRFLTTTGNVTGVEIRVTPANAVFYGQVVDAAGQPLPGIRLRVHGQTGSDYYDGNDPVTDDQGRFTGLAVGGMPSWWTLMLDPVLNTSLTNSIASGFRLNQALAPGQAIHQNIRVLEATNLITGTVRDPHGQPVPGVGVFGWAVLNGETFYGSGMTTDLQGVYRMPVAGAPWQIQLACDDLLDEGFNCVPARTVPAMAPQSTVNFTVYPSPQPALSDPVQVAPGQFRFQVHGEPFVTYQVQVSSNLRQWQDLMQITPAMDGPVYVNTTVTDPGASSSPRFYRLLRR